MHDQHLVYRKEHFFFQGNGHVPYNNGKLNPAFQVLGNTKTHVKKKSNASTIKIISPYAKGSWEVREWKERKRIRVKRKIVRLN